MRVFTGWLTFLVFALSIAAGIGGTYAWQSRESGTAELLTSPSEVIGGYLRLSPTQLEEIESVDPLFAAERTALEAALARERTTLANMFEMDQAVNEEILAQVERTIAAHDSLERRVANYLLALRPHLTKDQRSQLFRRCAEGVRDASARCPCRNRYGGGGESAESRCCGRCLADRPPESGPDSSTPIEP